MSHGSDQRNTCTASSADKKSSKVMNCAASELYQIFVISSLAFLIVCQRQPRNITRADGETDVFIPCPFEFRPTPSIWKIRGREYTAVTIPSIFSITPSGLFINRVDVCLDQASFQCIDTSDNALEEQVSDIGVLTVTSQDNCTAEDMELLFGEIPPQLELDHRLIRYGSINTTLAWMIVPVEDNCSTSHIVSYRQCEQNNVNLNLTTDDEMITLSSASLQLSGELVDFSLSSSSSQLLTEQCPRLLDTLRFNVTETETVNLLVGNNNCTCVDIERRGGLSFAVSNPDPDPDPDPDEVDIVCRVRGNGCYSPVTCNNFNGSGLIPFFRLCDNPSENSYRLCFANISEKLNSSRLDLFALKRALCGSTPVYTAREYFRSFELNVTKASASISVNTTSRKICFTSNSNDCSLTNLTQYNISIIDIYRNVVVERDNIPESTCQIFDHLNLLPQCGPFLVSTQPFNDYIVYSLDVQQVISDIKTADDEPQLCSCLAASSGLELATQYNSQNSSVEVNYQCWTNYTTLLLITLIDEDGFVNRTTYTCSNGRFPLSINSNNCDHKLRLCGYFTFMNGSVLIDCPLSCSKPLLIPCPTIPTTGPGPGPSLGVIIGSVVGGVLLAVIVLVIMLCCVVPRCGRDRWSFKANLKYIVNTEGKMQLYNHYTVAS